MNHEDRRLRRSSDPITALHYQLAHARSEGGLSAMVLVDETGALVAGAGAWPVCEELAAYAPLLARRESLHGETQATIDAYRSEVTLRSLSVDGYEVFLAARGAPGRAVDASMVRAAAGCRRILGAET